MQKSSAQRDVYNVQENYNKKLLNEELNFSNQKNNNKTKP